MEKANVENVGITLVFPCMREFQVEEMGKLLKKVENWCEKRQTRVEILVNDWGNGSAGQRKRGISGTLSRCTFEQTEKRSADAL